MTAACPRLVKSLELLNVGGRTDGAAFAHLTWPASILEKGDFQSAGARVCRGTAAFSRDGAMCRTTPTAS